MKILIIEDDIKIVSALNIFLELGWSAVEVLSTDWGKKGIELAETEHPDIIILDLGLPDIYGIEVLKEIRLFSDVPILVLTVNTNERLVVQALGLGADDYVFKPFREMELIARLKRLFSRHSIANHGISLSWGAIQYDYDKREIIYRTKKIRLSHIENDIFLKLIQHAPSIVNRIDLVRTIWGEYSSNLSNSLKVHIRHLRQKIEDDPDKPIVILTKPGGYSLSK